METQLITIFSGLAFSAHLSLQVAGHHFFILTMLPDTQAPLLLMCYILEARISSKRLAQLFQFFTRITLDMWTK